MVNRGSCNVSLDITLECVVVELLMHVLLERAHLGGIFEAFHHEGDLFDGLGTNLTVLSCFDHLCLERFVLGFEERIPLILRGLFPVWNELARDSILLLPSIGG